MKQMNNKPQNPRFATSREFRHLYSDLDHSMFNLLDLVGSILSTCDETTLCHLVHDIDTLITELSVYENEDIKPTEESD